MARPRSKKNLARLLGQRQAVIVVQPNDQVGKRARFEAMQKLIRPKEEKPRE